MLRSFTKCRDGGKCAYIGLGTLFACIIGAVSLAYIDGGGNRASVVDGVHYDNNPWTRVD